MSLDLQSQLQRYVGLDEREIAAAVSGLISTSRTLVDVGANDGYYTMTFLNSTADCVIACEPGLVSDQLLANAAANGHKVSSRFHLEPRLIGNDVGEAKLAELLDQCPLPILVKVDVDGGELGVLQSSEGYPHLNRISWVVETHSVDLENACIDWFSRHRFCAHAIDPAWWRRLVPEQRVIAHNRWLIAEPA